MSFITLIMIPPDFRRIFHWGPLFALTIIFSITWCTINVTSMWLPMFSSTKSFLIHISFMVFVLLTLTNFFSAMFIGPGYVPLDWRPVIEEDCRLLQYCNLCKSYKAPRAHHCRKCNRCVMKMDHHCPWINNCCGHRNHAKFTTFLLSAILGCTEASILLSISFYKAFHLNWYFLHGDRSRIVYLSVYSLAFSIFSLGLALGVVIAVGGLFYVQIKSILRNETCIENWIVAKALSRPREENEVFIYPYNLGRWNNLKQIFWEKQGNGIYWPIVEGCHQYSLTIEQLYQKQDKRARMKQYTIIEVYNGSWLPLSKGVRTCFSPPCTDEPRIPLAIGNCVLVTRWKRHWLYGEKREDPINNDGENLGPKGWFPRCCAVELIYPEYDISKVSKKTM